MSDSLTHYGTPRHSGRYPWGSGKDPYQRNKSFLGYVKGLRDEGMTDKEIARGMNMSIKELRARYSLAKDEKRIADAAEAYRLKEKGYSNVAIGKRMGINESSVRSLLDPAIQKRSEATKATAQALKDSIKDGGYLDIGAGTEHYMGCSRTKLETAVEYLKAEGYVTQEIKQQQAGTGMYTTIKVLCPPGTTASDVYKNKDLINAPFEWSDDGGYTYKKPQKPVAISADRIQIRYAEEGGKDKDGVIELRRGVDDISLGNSTYAQVRINVDDTHYLKGMAVYSDKMPKGTDIIFNTNKHVGTPKDEVMKELKKTKDGKVDWENPFGATIREDRQRTYIDKNGKEKQSAINIVNSEGDWENWKKTLSSQMLSKQSPALAKKQLKLGLEAKQSQFDEINNLTNPVVKKKLLLSFADECDSSAVHLEAAAMPRQGSHVILPLTTLKDNEIYAPRFKDGESVVLIRYPHAGQFEIPELKVNNRNKEGDKVISKKAKDAVGINSKVAERLSGADFDGDTVLVIPNKKGPYSIKTRSPLQGLKDFDPKEAYPAVKGMKKLTDQQKGTEMGKISNLITDMTIGGASDEELAAAVRHSMVVIDAVKHNLNYKQSYIDNDIDRLKKAYQKKEGGKYGGASTLISRAKAQTHVPVYTERIDKETGAKVRYDKKETYINREGKRVFRTKESNQMSDTSNALDLMSHSGSIIEKVYGDHANSLKKLANEARKISVNTPNPPISRSAKETYSKEVASLEGKLINAQKNAPKERKAQLIANVEVKAKREANPDMDKDDLKKLKNQALQRARDRVGADKKSVMVDITDKEWEAIQAGAIGSTKLNQILNNTDEDRIKQLSMPKNKPTMTDARVARAKSMINAGCTLAEVAEILGVSVSTISRSIS